MNSLERRLQLGLTLSLIILMGGFWIAGNQSIRMLTEDFIASRLKHDMENLLATLVLDPDHPRVRWRRINHIYNQPFSGHYYVIRLADGRELGSRSLWDQTLVCPMLAPGESASRRAEGPSGQKLLLWIQGVSKQEQTITLCVAEDLTPLKQHRDRFKWHFALLAIGGLLVLLVVQRLVVRRSFRRLLPVREDIRRLEQGETDRLSENVPSEVLPLVREFNHLLRLLSLRLERSRNALGNLTHALKGPLNLLVQYLDRVETDSDAAQRKQAKSQTERIRQLMERELKRARLAGTGIPTHRFDARKELPDLVGLLKQVYHERSLNIQYRVAADVSHFGDREDMLELMGNLLDNACKWAETQVRCKLSATTEGLHIQIEDDGQGLSTDELAGLDRRGIRLDETVEGHGLGLAIAKDIVHLYGGEMRFSRSTEWGGLQIQITLPRG